MQGSSQKNNQFDSFTFSLFRWTVRHLSIMEKERLSSSGATDIEDRAGLNVYHTGQGRIPGMLHPNVRQA
jgi:hypothetical protein